MTDATTTTAKEAVFSFLGTKGTIPGSSEAEQRAYDYLEGGLLDSFGIVEMVTDLEARFDIKFSTEDLQAPEFRTVGGLIGIVERLRAG